MLKVSQPIALTAADFSRRWAAVLDRMIRPLPDRPRIAVALSGGSDSVALSHLAIQHFGHDRVTLLTVNHSLPSFYVEPKQEIDAVIERQFPKCSHRWLSLDWSVEDQRLLRNRPSHAQFEARDRRYEALLRECDELGCDVLLLGHNLDDDFVTSCHRVSRFSCIDGIASMKPVSPFPVVNASRCLIARPLLEDAKATLKATCVANDLHWVEDETNQSRDYQRNDAMQAIEQAQQTDPLLTTESIRSLMSTLKQFRSHISAQVCAALEASTAFNPHEGTVLLCLNEPKWISCLPIARRVVGIAVQSSSSGQYPPSSVSATEIARSLRSAFQAHQLHREKRRSLIPSYLLRQFSTEDSEIVGLTKKLPLRSSTLQNTLVYALTCSDAIFRLKELHLKRKIALEPGPCVLFTAAKAPHHQKAEPAPIKVAHGEQIKWAKGRFSLTFQMDDPERAKAVLVLPLTVETVHQHKRAILLSSSMPRLVPFLQSTPATLFHNYVAIFDEQDRTRCCIPHLDYRSKGCDFSVKLKFLGEHQYSQMQYS